MVAGGAAASAMAATSTQTEGRRAWDYAAQDQDWGGLCHVSGQQSPINIDPADASASSSAPSASSGLQGRLLYRPWRPEDVEPAQTVGAPDVRKVPRFVFRPTASPGRLQVGRDFNDFDEYALAAVEVHAPSEHTLQQASWPVELQLWHDPMPPLRILHVGQQVSALAREHDSVEPRLELMGRLAQQLRMELSGENISWALEDTARSTSTGTFLDTIDAVKEQILAEAQELREKTNADLQWTEKLVSETEAIVDAQRRPFATRRVVLSIFLGRAPPWFPGVLNSTGLQLVRWVAEALSSFSGREAWELDPLSALDPNEDGSGRQFFMYEGSLARPPCTPIVRWFVADRPIMVASEGLETLLAAASLGGGVPRLGDATDGVRGDAREVQPLGEGSDLKRVSIYSGSFEPPALLPVSENVDDKEKWGYLQRYCQVFVLCSALLCCAPCALWAWSQCQSGVDQGDSAGDVGDMLHLSDDTWARSVSAESTRSQISVRSAWKDSPNLAAVPGRRVMPFAE